MQVDSELDALLVKSTHLTYFRLAFAGIILLFSFFVQRFGPSDIDPVGLVASSLTVLVFNIVAYLLLKSKTRLSHWSIDALNAALLAVDITALSCVVHFTRGLESDLFFLYLLPILLASNVFARKGIFITALVASLAYVLTVVMENAGFLKYLLGDSSSGLTAAYSHRLFMQILSRSLILFLVSLIWAAFCHRMSKIVLESNDRLAEQLKANNRLLEELKSQAKREQLSNVISLALRKTLNLEKILGTTCSELSQALNAEQCILISMAGSKDGAPILWDSQLLSGRQEKSKIPASVKNYLMEHRWKRNESQKSRSTAEILLSENVSNGSDLALSSATVPSEFKKMLISHAPFTDPEIDPLSRELMGMNIATILVRPIMYGNSVKGVLAILSENIPRQWTAAELEIIDTVAGQVAIAIEHAELVSKLSETNVDLLIKNENLDAKNLELREVQSQLIHHEKMASLGRIVAGIAHELNNPINFVHGNLPYLKEYFQEMRQLIDCFDQLPEEYRKLSDETKQKINYQFVITDLDNIIADLFEGTDRIRQIIRNLRSFSRLDEAELKEALIEEGIESTLKILSQYYGRDKIPVEIEFCKLPPVLCFPGKLNQVWMNLLSNAAEAVSNRPHPLVKIRTRMDDEFALVSIEDNGPGINSSDQSKIFEPFFTTKPVGQGTGLGLSISHSIVERHGGLIWFESNPDKGTCFTVKIPLKGPSRNGEEEQEEVAINERRHPRQGEVKRV